MFGADIYLTGGIVADEQHRKSRRASSGTAESGNSLLYPFAQLRRKGFAVNYHALESRQVVTKPDEQHLHNPQANDQHDGGKIDHSRIGHKFTNGP